MAMQVVKDKVYYLSEKLGLPGKGYLSKLLDVSEQTLRLWSYNPANVHEETSELIFRRIAYLDLMGMEFEKVSDRLPDPRGLDYDKDKQKFLWPPSQTDYMWHIWTRSHGDSVYTKDFWRVGRSMLCFVEERESKYIVNYSDEGVKAMRSGRGYYSGYPWLSNIAKDKDLEMPVGVTNWTKYHELKEAAEASD